jgi:hypothetical protein
VGGYLQMVAQWSDNASQAWPVRAGHPYTASVVLPDLGNQHFGA